MLLVFIQIKFASLFLDTWVSQVALAIKNLADNAGDVRDAGLIPGWRRSLEEGMATHSSILV